jgi:protein-serine/threonine kinase
MEKRGGLIWVLEEITEKVSRESDGKQGKRSVIDWPFWTTDGPHIFSTAPLAWNVVSAKGAVEKIWGPSVVQKGQSITDLLPCLP